MDPIQAGIPRYRLVRWLASNLRVAAALAEAGDDFRLVLGDGGHSPNHAGVLLPDALPWLLRHRERDQGTLACGDRAGAYSDGNAAGDQGATAGYAFLVRAARAVVAHAQEKHPVFGSGFDVHD